MSNEFYIDSTNNEIVDPSNPDTIPKFTDKLPRPPVMRPLIENGNVYYEIEMKESYHSFHKQFPLTYIWGYEGIFPGPTIEAVKDKSIWVRWINNLPSKHFLPVDRTLHGASDSPEVRSVVHLHGANVDWESDGHLMLGLQKITPLLGKLLRERFIDIPITSLVP